MSRGSYTRARQKSQTPQEAKLRPALERIARKVYTTASPVVKPVTDAVKKGAVSTAEGYLKGADAVANKLRPLFNKLPNPPQQRRVRRRPQK